MKLCDIINDCSIIEALEARTANGVLGEMVDKLVSGRKLSLGQRDAIFRALVARERKGTTGFGGGVAIPHIKHHTVKEFVGAVAVSKAGVDFSALDHRPVHVFFLLLSPPEEPLEHLKAMENIFRAIQNQNWCRFLKQARDKAEIAELLREADEEAKG